MTSTRVSLTSLELDVLEDAATSYTFEMADDPMPQHADDVRERDGRAKALTSAMYKIEAARKRVERVAPQPPPHDCESCKTSVEKCDDRIHVGKSACCTTCGYSDTHGDSPSRFTERLVARGLL